MHKKHWLFTLFFHKSITAYLVSIHALINSPADLRENIYLIINSKIYFKL